MRAFKIIGAVVAFAAMGIAAAHAAPGYSTVNLNLRTGPDTEFPRVDVIPEGDPIEVLGCLRDESWCDIVWDGNRGWVFSEYIAVDYRGEYVPLPDYGLSAFRIPVVRFAASDYWGRHYVGRPWYSERQRWYRHTPRVRQGWRAPPSGKRTPGWWRSGYQAPKGMRPPERGWKRPDRHRGGAQHHDRRRGDAHDARRDGRGDGRHDGRQDGRHDGRHDHGRR
ncbi:SH3 domain-containing protein [Hyphomicrobium sp.]|uniref:SH3 domain-containing protein n=1 Tax=Hyphomicrobium sp. TaxID=82 RepID=UPI002CCC5529|nr:SH3 domain-containing protein [Hyphomicrobium sp.]HRN87608.1 SH3 domain-containing protein [Hyphomicrobium sp.]HRQ27065.1 SH3 domain-containing protein [Hyphomicrobium sp.]